MATTRSERDLSCPVCHHIFTDPVILPCSHSFCKNCLQSWWKEKPTCECPVCKNRSFKEEPLCNLALKNLCEAFVQEREQRAVDPLCSLHQEKLKLFCLDHREPVCVICRDSEKHSGHSFSPIDEAVRKPRKELEKTLEISKKKLQSLVEVKLKSEQIAKHIKVQARRTEKQIKDQFKKLHGFLEEEEEVRLAALREEEEEKSRTMKNKMAALTKETNALSKTVKAAEEQLKITDASFLLNYKSVAQNVKTNPVLEDPQMLAGTLIDQAKHLGNLTVNVWNNMQDIVTYTPLILNPNTAHPGLALSVDLTSVRSSLTQTHTQKQTQTQKHTQTHTQTQLLPDNPERFDEIVSVLTSEGFNSGAHSWDVDVGDSADWFLGVTAESARRKGHKKNGILGIGLNAGEYTAECPLEPDTVIRIEEKKKEEKKKEKEKEKKKKLEKVRVSLDWDGGRLTFYDGDTDACIHTFTHTFTEKMFPLICNGDRAVPLKILPLRVRVTVRDSS